MLNTTKTTTIPRELTPCNMSFKISSKENGRRYSIVRLEQYQNIPCTIARDYINTLDTSSYSDQHKIKYDIRENGDAYSANDYETLPNAVANIDHFMKNQAYLSK